VLFLDQELIPYIATHLTLFHLVLLRGGMTSSEKAEGSIVSN